MLALRAVYQGKHFSDSERHEVLEKVIDLACAIVRKSGAAAFVEAERAKEQVESGKRPGGRPALINTTSALHVWLTRALLRDTFRVSDIAEWLNDIDHSHLERLGLHPYVLAPEKPGKLYERFWRATERMLGPLNAEPAPRRKRMTHEEYEFVLAHRDNEECEKRRRNRLVFMNLLVLASNYTVPREIRRRELGVYSVDATCVEMPGRAKSRRSRWAATIPDAGWYVREPKHAHYGHDGADQDGYRRKDGGRTYIWGMEAEIVTAARPTDATDTYPLLIKAANWHKPSSAPGKAAVEAFELLAKYAPEMRRHRVSPDRLYVPNSSVDVFHRPMRELGFTFTMDYQTNQLGIQDAYAGALLVEGTFMCPATPQALIAATIDHRTQQIDDETYAKRIEERRVFALRPKEAPGPTGRKFMCPAAGPAATVACPRKPQHPKAKPSKTILRMQLPATQDAVCTNKSSVTIPHEAGEKYRQDIPYATIQWRNAYHGPRNTIEGVNFRVKGTEGLGASEQRLSRSLTTQFLYAIADMIAANVTRVFTWLAEHKDDLALASTDRADKPNNDVQPGGNTPEPPTPLHPPPV